MLFHKLNIHDHYRRSVQRFTDLLTVQKKEFHQGEHSSFFRECRFQYSALIEKELLHRYSRKGPVPFDLNQERIPVELGIWNYLRRPFCRVFPKQTDSLLNFNLKDFESFSLFPGLEVIELEFAAGCEIPFGESKIGTILLTAAEQENTEKEVTLIPFNTDHFPLFAWNDRIDSFADYFAKMKRSDIKNLFGQAGLDKVLPLFSLAAGFLTLSKTSDLFSPIPLKKDEDRFARSKDPDERQKLISKAVRTGLIGYNLGMELY